MLAAHGEGKLTLQGGLYSRDYLERGITEEPEWQAIDAGQLAAVRDQLLGLFRVFPVTGNPVEGVTEQDLIYPVLKALGWTDMLVQQQVSRRRRDDVPDGLLFADPQAKALANAEKDPHQRYRHGLVIVEAKRWQWSLDRADAQGHTPSSQMLRYMRRAEESTDGRMQWGVLTNGRLWRLYWQGARSRAEEFLELDLPSVLNVPGFPLDLFTASQGSDHWLRVFLLMFGRASFVAAPDQRGTFHTRALSATRKWEARVAEDLSKEVFGNVYPALVRGIAASALQVGGLRGLAQADLDAIRHAALTLLYRLLFVLFAEDRGLLPARHPGYETYSLDKLRGDIAVQIDGKTTLSDRTARTYAALRGLFAAIDLGDPSLGLPPYNGGLFDPADHTLLDRVQLPDALMAKVIDALSRRDEAGKRLRINYRDLSVQQLGSIYERLLEYSVVPDASDTVTIQLQPFARKGSGSYYTPEELVRLIIERTVGPLLDERQSAFAARLGEAADASGRITDRVERLRQFDPATAFLGLRVCDPAMGSGHFLVSLVDYMADRTLTAMADAQARVYGVFADKGQYRSPLQDRIDGIRAHIRDRATKEGWAVAESQLDDRHLVRRIILKRVVYGVDKNPMAVELAKVSLWLHTFTVGAPLSFLDHHLRCGDSLFGEFVRPVEDFLNARGSLALVRPLQQAKASAKGMAIIEDMTDADLVEVERSEAEFTRVASATQPIAHFLDTFHALRWLERLPPTKGKEINKKGRIAAKAQSERSVELQRAGMLLEGVYGDPVEFVTKVAEASVNPGLRPTPPATTPTGGKIDPKEWTHCFDLVARAAAVARRERFLHWQVAFPGVWASWESVEPIGGFDAIIGNPPWDRIKLQEVEWFATRRLDIAKQQRASDRAKAIRALEKSGDPLYGDYLRAADAAESAASVARDSGYYPLLSGGDINIYSLFVERALALIQPSGMVGLLCPSGIAADKGASDFFGQVATSGRLFALFDFENRRTRFGLEPFFPDVDSRFKFCAFMIGGKSRAFEQSPCAFFLQSPSEIDDSARCFNLTPRDFSQVNPNTRTAPVFRTRLDADIVRGIYERLPVLSDHAKGDKGMAWPVRYRTMFHMTNDASLFHKRVELHNEGAYPVEGGRMKKGYTEFVPLYEGKMVQAFDHRAASVIVNLENLNRPAQPEPATDEQKRDAHWLPTPQFWVNDKEVQLPNNTQYVLGFKEITAPTNMRTMIAALLPPFAFGNKVPLLLWEKPPIDTARSSQYDAVFLVANLNAFVFDFVTRQKIQGQTLNWFIVEQLPIVPPVSYRDKIGSVSVADLVKHEVLHLTYTAHDMRPFAEDLGFCGEPFRWDEEDRRHRRARLDAIYFRLYGIDEDDAAYILDTFPIVREQDEAAFGRYRTKEMILAYMRAFAAGDTSSRIAL